MDFKNQIGGFFLFRLTGVQGKTIRIDCRNVPLEKWASLNPVYSAEGNALVMVPALVKKLDNTKLTATRNGSRLPPDEAPWNFITQVWASSAVQLSFVQHFDQDTVFVAMRPPFTLGQQDAVLAECRANPLCQVVAVGKSQEGRALSIIKISETGGSKPCIVVYAREHADEPDGSWAALGALRSLLSDAPWAATMRHAFTFYFIPILDPDGAAHGDHERIIGTFLPNISSQESIAYANYFRKEIPASGGLAVVLNFHNVISFEAPHLTPPLMPAKPDAAKAGEAVHKLVLDEATAGGFSVNVHAWNSGEAPERLGGWLTEIFGGVHLPYEINSQQPARHLTPSEVQVLGSEVLSGVEGYFESPEGDALVARSKDQKMAYESRWRSSVAAMEKVDQGNENPFVLEKSRLTSAADDGILKAMMNK